MKIQKMLAYACLFSVVTLFGCDSDNSKRGNHNTTKPQVTLSVAHSLNQTHATHLAIQEMADLIEKNTQGKIKVKIFPNAQLGADSATLEQAMAGVVAMTNVASPAMGTYEEGYHTFGLPYLFSNKEEYYKVMDSEPMHKFFLSTLDKGFVVLTYFTSGQRSFYTINKAIRKPEDLHGMKIRVQDMKSQTDMMRALGGVPIAMAYGEVFTSLQTGIIDGTENNELALTQANHGEICKVFSVDQHAMIPDVLVMSGKVWQTLSPEDQEIILKAADQATQHHKKAWDKATEEAVETAKTKMGVTFITDIDKEPFIKATASLREEYANKYAGVNKILNVIENIKKGYDHE